MPLGNRGQNTVGCKILEPVLPRELLPFDRGLLGRMEVALEETEAKVV
jgi:hypothetical protein